MSILEEASTHLAFHASQLKKALGQQVVQPTLPPLSKRFEWETVPEEVCGYHNNPALGEWKALVAWKRLPAQDATWEVVDYFANSFLHSTLRTR